MDNNLRDKIIDSYREHFSWAKVSIALNIKRRRLYNLRKRYLIDEEFKISNDDLFQEVSNVTAECPMAGSKLVLAHLQAKGIQVVRDRVRDFLKVVNPVAAEMRADRTLKNFTRGIYMTPGVNFLWHIDAWLKLVMYGISVKGIIDGFSRKIINVAAHTNNTATTLAKLFMETIQIEGIPSHIRIDKGGENRKIALMMIILLESIVENPVFIGTSTSNQKIERWWRDCRRYCLQTYKGMFEYLESLPIPSRFGNFYLHRYDSNHIFLLQYLFMFRINQSLQNFRNMWNYHRLKLPESFHHISITGKISKSWVPENVYQNYPRNFTIDQKVLERITLNNEYCNHLFHHDNNENDINDINNGLEINVALWTYDENILNSIYQRFQPLTLDDSIDECIQRYIRIINFLYDRI